MTPLTRARVLSLAWPIVLAQAATAMTGVVDTVVMGLHGDKADLAAVAVASVAFTFIYWGFGFLRMSTTGLTAQASGAADTLEVRAILLRALVFGAALGAALVLASPGLKSVAFWAFEAEAAVEALSKAYFDARIWGAPALLMGYAVTGALLGQGRTRALLAFQIVMNGVNGVLDWWFVAGLDLGPAGIGAGTAIAEWTALVFGLVLIRDGFGARAAVFDRAKLAAMFAANRDIMIRTLALLFAFAWFVNSGAQVGTAALAGNEVLLQFITVSAFVLDSFAFVAEKETGEAVGARDPAHLKRAVRLTSELAMGFGAAFALSYYLGGSWIITAVVADPEARAAALAYLPFCAAAPLLGAPAWQLDGVFIGATEGAALRNAGLAFAVLYVLTDLWLSPRYGNAGVWSAFLLMYVYRAILLGAHWPRLMSRVRQDQPRRPQPAS